MSLSIVLEEIKTSPSSLIPILSILHEKPHLDHISKSDLTHLISRTLQLCRTPNIYNKWCGINIINVLSDNYVILANEGANFMTMLITILESYNNTIDVVILKSCVECLNKLIKIIRNKPALTREILTPKLATIISLYLKHLQYAPNLCIKSLYQIIKHHPTTFRPFANKFGEKLYTLMQSGEFVEYPTHLQTSVCKALAILPTVEKHEPESKWANDVDNIIAEIKGVIEIYDEFLNFRDDSQLKNLLQKLPQSTTKVFPSLEIDLNRPKSLLQISSRVYVLTKLLGAYLNEGVSSVKVPLGKIFALVELICSVNLKYLSFKSDIRDEEIKGLIKDMLSVNYQSAIALLRSLLVFKGSLIPHLPSLWSSLAYIVPLSKSGKVTKVSGNETLYMDLVSCVSDYLQLVGMISDNTLMTPFVDVALALVEVRPTQAEPEKAASISQQKKGKKKNVSSAPLSDILSHEHLFTQSKSKQLLNVVRTFLHQVIKRSELPPTQHYKVVKFVVQECVEAAAANYETTVPESFRDLLRGAVLNPGYDRHNILPIVSSIIPNDELLSVFNNPRLPPLPKRIATTVELEDDLEDVLDTEETQEQASAKESAVLKLLEEQRQQEQAIEPQDSSGLIKREVEDSPPESLKKRKIETTQADFSFKPNSSVSAAPEKPKEYNVETDVQTAASPVHDDAESDFEMPEINMEEDSDEEEEE
ncbi:RIX1 [Candida theae]|uniref:Pre-rRNA-processing protein RIX1 n=1 Tax=Candida theae TaxID=1198502 RepID=A0AAD5BEY9_9ASCO|nr:RIX1 [Candida theae]KAI5958565.1 RIX1 [Candida theae]